MESDNNRNGTTTQENIAPERTDIEIPMCSICHSEPPVNAVKLDCGHIFCFLCIKSASETTGTCALCRSEIGIEFNFQYHNILGVARVPSSQNGYYWFYEGFRGWWLYDAETNRDIEEAFGKGQQTLERFIAGYMYIIDLENKTQQRKEGDGRSRKICRSELDQVNILGMSGIRDPDFNEILDMMKSAENIEMSHPS